jgi:hypothetical protein
MTLACRQYQGGHSSFAAHIGIRAPSEHRPDLFGLSAFRGCKQPYAETSQIWSGTSPGLEPLSDIVPTVLDRQVYGGTPGAISRIQIRTGLKQQLQNVEWLIDCCPHQGSGPLREARKPISAIGIQGRVGICTSLYELLQKSLISCANGPQHGRSDSYIRSQFEQELNFVAVFVPQSSLQFSQPIGRACVDVRP